MALVIGGVVAGQRFGKGPRPRGATVEVTRDVVEPGPEPQVAARAS
jgi:hypothetical protein